MSRSRYHPQRASLAPRTVELFSISSWRQNASLAQQGLPTASSRATSLRRQYYCLPGGRRSASSLRASSRVRWRGGTLLLCLPFIFEQGQDVLPQQARAGVRVQGRHCWPHQHLWARGRRAVKAEPSRALRGLDVGARRKLRRHQARRARAINHRRPTAKTMIAVAIPATISPKLCPAGETG